jgi:hypothetical protein
MLLIKHSVHAFNHFMCMLAAATGGQYSQQGGTYAWMTLAVPWQWPPCCAIPGLDCPEKLAAARTGTQYT